MLFVRRLLLEKEKTDDCGKCEKGYIWKQIINSYFVKLVYE